MTLVRIEHDDRVAVMTLDDPTRRNALSVELCGEMVAALGDLAADEGTGALVVAGAGPAFCAGADLSQLGESRDAGLRRIYDGFLAVARFPVPTVAAVGGPAVGAGMNLALACDLRLTGDGARFDTRFLDLGIHPGGGHTWMLRRLVGPQTAAAMVLFGEVLDGPAAVAAGLAMEHVAGGADALTARAVEVANRAAGMPRDLSIAAKTTLADVAAIDSHDDAVELELARQLHSMDQPAFAARLASLRSRIRAEDRPSRD